MKNKIKRVINLWKQYKDLKIKNTEQYFNLIIFMCNFLSNNYVPKMLGMHV
jgi:hypothetical protein